MSAGSFVDSSTMALVYLLIFVAALGSISARPSEEKLIGETYPGGEVEQDPTDPKYFKLAVEAFNQYWWDHHNESTDEADITVTKVTTQLVDGLITRLHFHLDFPEVLTCHAKVYEYWWKNNKVIDVQCGIFQCGK